MFRRFVGPKSGWSNRTRVCVLTWAVMVALAADNSAGQSPPASHRQDSDACARQLAKIKDDLNSRLFAEVRSAIAKGLGPEALALCGEVLASQPENKMAAQWAQRAQNAIKAAAARPRTNAQVSSLPVARQAMAEATEKARKDAIARYLALAQSCEGKNLPQDKARCLAEAIALDPNNEPLHLAAGEKVVPGFGWAKEEFRKKLADGLWFTDGQWKKWEDVSKSRIDTLKARESGGLGEGFRYTATHHLTVANNLKDLEFEKDLIHALELCVIDQRTRLFEPFEPGRDKPLNVIVFQERSEFTEYCRRIRSANGDSMGFYDPDRRTLHAWRKDGDITNGIGTSFHEATHGTLEDYMGESNLPAWLDEGVASFHEKTRVKGDRMNFGPINVPRMGGLQQFLAAGQTITLQELIHLDRAKWEERLMLNYNASAMLMHYLWERGALQSFLRNFKSSRNAQDALVVTLKQDFDTTDREYQAFLRERLLDPEALTKMKKQMEGTWPPY